MKTLINKLINSNSKTLALLNMKHHNDSVRLTANLILNIKNCNICKSPKQFTNEKD